MGGEGSGRTQEIVSMADVLMTDEEFKDNLARLTVSQFNAVVDKVYQAAIGNAYEERLTPKGGKITVRISCGDMIKAAKVWKEMTLDKVVSDKKTIDAQGQGSLLDHLEALKAIEESMANERAEKARAAEETAAESGKLVKIGGS